MISHKDTKFDELNPPSVAARESFRMHPTFRVAQELKVIKANRHQTQFERMLPYYQAQRA